MKMLKLLCFLGVSLLLKIALIQELIILFLILFERETGYGRSVLIIQDPVRNRCIILELKHVKNESEMEGAL